MVRKEFMRTRRTPKLQISNDTINELTKARNWGKQLLENPKIRVLGLMCRRCVSKKEEKAR